MHTIDSIDKELMQISIRLNSDYYKRATRAARELYARADVLLDARNDIIYGRVNPKDVIGGVPVLKTDKKVGNSG